MATTIRMSSRSGWSVKSSGRWGEGGIGTLRGGSGGFGGGLLTCRYPPTVVAGASRSRGLLGIIRA